MGPASHGKENGLSSGQWKTIEDCLSRGRDLFIFLSDYLSSAKWRCREQE